MYSFQLFATPTFFSGMARTLDLGAVLDDYDGILISEQVDRLALCADWLAVSEDMWSALAEGEIPPISFWKSPSAARFSRA